MMRLQRPLRFAIVGCANTAVGLGVIYGCKIAFGLGDLWANVCGYAVGLAVSFLLNSRWTFAYDGAWTPAVFRFLGAFLLSYAINLAVVMALIEGADVNGYVAQAAGVLSYAVSFYLLSRTMVFRRPSARAEKAA